MFQPPPWVVIGLFPQVLSNNVHTGSLSFSSHLFIS